MTVSVVEATVIWEKAYADWFEYMDIVIDRKEAPYCYAMYEGNNRVIGSYYILTTHNVRLEDEVDIPEHSVSQILTWLLSGNESTTIDLNDWVKLKLIREMTGKGL
ncbi:hypothetical protein D3C74_49720 [compost metagenome]